MAEMCPAWFSAKVQVGGAAFYGLDVCLLDLCKKMSLSALKNKESGEILLYCLKQTVMLFISLKSKMSAKTSDVTTNVLQQARENGTWVVEGSDP